MATQTRTQTRDSGREPDCSLRRYTGGGYFIDAAVWESRDEDSGRLKFSVKLTPQRVENGEYETLRNFSDHQLLALAKLVDQIDTWCQERRREAAQS